MAFNVVIQFYFGTILINSKYNLDKTLHLKYILYENIEALFRTLILIYRHTNIHTKKTRF